MHGAPQPSPRSRHAAVCLDYNNNSPQLLVAGKHDGEASSDVWCLNVQTQSWQKVRSYHYSIAQMIIDVDVNKLSLISLQLLHNLMYEIKLFHSVVSQ